MNKYKPLDFDYLLVRQLFVTSSMPADPVIAVTLSDIIKINNILVENKEMPWIKSSNSQADRTFPDPLGKLREGLGDKIIQITDPTVNLERQMNLRIKCRFLISHSKLIKCKHCMAPVVDTMLPGFHERYSGEEW